MITLEAIKSPFVVKEENRTVNLDDLIIALRICSTQNWSLAIKEPSFFEKIKYNKLYIDSESMAIAFVEFSLYIKESTSGPKLWIKNNDSENGNKNVNNSDGIPPSLSVVSMLMSKFNFNENDAWELAYCRAMWYGIAFSAQEGGDVKIITTEEEDNAEKDKAKLDEIEKQAKEKYKNNG